MTPRDLDQLAPEAVPGVRLLPVVHDRIELAAVARAVLDRLDPAAVAVELPVTLAEAVGRAIARLPKVSLVIAEEPGADALVWAGAPGDPFAEALRWAAERDRPRYFIDPDLRTWRGRMPAASEADDTAAEAAADDPRPSGGGAAADRPVPDPWAILRLGPALYLEALSEGAGAAPPDELDLRREEGMAYHLQVARARLDREGRPGPLLALVGAAHVRRLARRLATPAATPLARPRRQRVDLRHLHPQSLTAMLPDPPLGHAAWELVRTGEPLPPEPPLAATAGTRLTLLRAGLRLVSREPESWGSERRRRLAEVAAHRGVAPPGATGGPPIPDRFRLGRVAWAAAAGAYRVQTGEETAGWQRRLFFDFAHRHARCQGLLAPGLYEWVVAARGVGDDNLAWEVFDAVRAYPWQEETAELPTVMIDGEELDLGTRRVRFRRRFFRVKQRPVPVKARPAPADPERWLDGFRGEGLCSYPPEDLVVEDWGRYLQARAVGLLSAERSRSEPFSTGLLDGVDVRETLSHPEDGRVWVREQGRAPGRAGAVVAIFDPDREGDRFPYLMTWLGEHDQESDMAFYSTHPADQVVGPGITRATYGGFLMTYPPGRLADVWSDPDYREARDRAEVLVLAAVDYSEEKLVVHLAARPPAERLRRHAAARGKRLVHLPLGSVSPATRKKIRTLHILAGRDKRQVARDYVW